MTVVFRHEMRLMWNGLTAYVYGAFFLVAVAIYMMYYNLTAGYANFEYAMAGAAFALIIIIPVITMRIIAEEKKQKTDQLLYSLPVSTTGIVAGKYLAALAAQVAKNFSDKEIYIYSFQDALDLDICKKFEMNLKIADDTLKTRIVSAVGVDEIVQSVSNLEYMIAMRYHACLLALKYGVKTMALSYDEKVQKLANRFGIPCLDLADIEKLPDYFEKLKTLDAKKIQTETENLDFDFSEILSVIKH